MALTNSELVAIKEQAAAWLIKMDNAELNEQESTEFEAWINISDFHLSYFNKLAKNWETMAALEPLADAYPIDSFKKTNDKYKSQKHVNTSQWWARLVSQPALAGYAVAMLLMLTITLRLDVAETQSYQTAAGEHASYTLADGSIIMLNTDTEVSVRYSKHQRLIKLKHGEANFDVAKNKDCPFVIEAGGGVVWAVGTVFDVRIIKNSVDVMVSRGTVKVYSDTNANSQSLSLDIPASSSNTEAIVTAGNAIQYQKIVGKVFALTEKGSLKRLAWLDGSIIFEGETLAQAIDEVSRYTRTQIIISDEEIKSMRIGGHYNTNDIDALLFALGKSFNIKVSKDAQGRIILSKQ